MSVNHYIRYRRNIKNSDLLKLVRKSLPKYKVKQIIYNQNESLIYADKASTKGVNLNVEYSYKRYNIQNTVMSNHIDYKISNVLASALCFLNNENDIKDEEGNILTSRQIYDLDKIEEKNISDANSLKAMSKSLDNFIIYGPLRKIHLGDRIYNKMVEYNAETNELYNYLEKLILKINYEFQDFDYGNVLEAKNRDEGSLILKVLTNKVTCMIDNYDYIILDRKETEPLMITNKILIHILPKKYTLIDNIAIAAPIISESEWNKLIQDAIPLNVYDEFSKQYNP